MRHSGHGRRKRRFDHIINDHQSFQFKRRRIIILPHFTQANYGIRTFERPPDYRFQQFCPVVKIMEASAVYMKDHLFTEDLSYQYKQRFAHEAASRRMMNMKNPDLPVCNTKPDHFENGSNIRAELLIKRFSNISRHEFEGRDVL